MYQWNQFILLVVPARLCLMYKSALPSFCMYVNVTCGLDVDTGVLAGMRPSLHLP
jgi:hypothetical protein